MQKKRTSQRKIHDLHPGDLIVDVDWGSTGIWFCDSNGKVCNGNYKDFDLPKSLVERFRFWAAWYNSHSPWNGETIDYDLFRAYGRALAVDLKRLVGDKARVFYDFRADNKRKCQISEEEILLPDEAKMREYLVGRIARTMM
jgi:hypothetical protein